MSFYSDEIESVFDSWEPLLKARKAKGLSKWERLSHISHKLEGKTQSDISFTTGYPGSEGQKKILGSVEGNLHFLMGYANPAFHVAAYHWQVVDPTLTDEEAEAIYSIKGHPSRPELWKKAELGDVGDEGDVVDGKPHETIAYSRDETNIKKKDSISVTVGAATYKLVPEEGLVYGTHNGHVYSWDLLKDSFLTAAHPELLEKMDLSSDEDDVEVEKSVNLPSIFTDYYRNIDFDDEVYPFVKSQFPRPGSVVTLETCTDENIYAAVTEKSVDFYNRSGEVVPVEIYDRVVKSMDLYEDGNMNPSVIYSFALNYLGVDHDSLKTYVEHTPVESENHMIKGEPTEGFESIDDDMFINNNNDLNKCVSIQDGTYKLVVRSVDE